MNETSMKEKIWNELASTDYNGFFITAEVVMEGDSYPTTLDAFIKEKLDAIQTKGISGRRFVFREAGWKIHLTFFPRTEVVSERYALKNRAYRQSQNK